jgi:hypothetical protein
LVEAFVELLLLNCWYWWIKKGPALWMDPEPVIWHSKAGIQQPTESSTGFSKVSRTSGREDEVECAQAKFRFQAEATSKKEGRR